MPCYFFHLTFGDRLLPDEEGVELPDRLAARDEALAVIRDLSDRAVGRRWASWFVLVADEQGPFLRLPIGHPAFDVVPKHPRQSEADAFEFEQGHLRQTLASKKPPNRSKETGGSYSTLRRNFA
jgi:hypothetical protein